jgi:hypothetical protein
VFRQVEADMFNTFITDTFLIDLPICGRLFTWYRGDGISMSRLDRFLLSEKWCEAWPNCIQVAYQRGLSDHVPLVLMVDEANWGPRPLRMLKCWVDFTGYSDFLNQQWSSFDVHGWGGYVLKHKLKMIKINLKEWHQRHSQNMEGKITSVKNRILFFDSKAEADMLLEEEVKELQELSVNLHSLSRIQCSISWQKSQFKWFQEGDENSKFFHGVMSNRRRRNNINVVNVNGVNIEGVHTIRAEVFNHFSNHFRHTNVVQPSVDHLPFRKLSANEARNLT